MYDTIFIILSGNYSYVNSICAQKMPKGYPHAKLYI